MLPFVLLAAFGFFLTGNSEFSGLGAFLFVWGIILAIAQTD